MRDRLPAGLRVLPVLTRHFFRRFFLNETMGFEEEMKLKMVAIGALVGGLAGFASNSLLFKYMFVPDVGQSWLEKGYFLMLLMVLSALLVVFEWDALFLDREDFRNLMPLPIRPRALFWSKLAALLLLVGLFTLLANALASLFFAVYLSQWRSSSLLFVARIIGVHNLSSLAATAFTALALAALIGALMAVLGPRSFRRASILIRFALLAFLTLLLLTMISDTLGVPRLLEPFKGLAARASDAVFRIPPLWFTGIYERGLGNREPLFAALAACGALAVVAGFAGFWLVFAAGYRRQVVKAEEVAARPGLFLAGRERLAGAFSAVALRNPVERAVFLFFARTLARSARHKWMFASTMAVPAALVFILISWARTQRGGGGLAPAQGQLLTAPLIVAVFLLAALRTIAQRPVAPEANWVFRLTELPSAAPYLDGLKKAVFFLGLLPLFSAVFLIFWPAWGAAAAGLHALFGLSTSMLLEEAFFHGFDKVPFACASLPGKERLQTRWFLYLGGFIIFLTLAGKLESSLYRVPGRFPAFFAAAFGLLLAFRLADRFYVYPRTRLVYEEISEPAFISMK